MIAAFFSWAQMAEQPPKKYPKHRTFKQKLNCTDTPVRVPFLFAQQLAAQKSIMGSHPAPKDDSHLWLNLGSNVSNDCPEPLRPPEVYGPS